MEQRVLILFLVLEVLSGPLRAMLAWLHLEVLIYAISGGILLFAVDRILRSPLTVGHALFFGWLGLQAVVGMLRLGSLAQVAAGFWSVWPFFLGLACKDAVPSFTAAQVRILLFIYGLVVVSVVLNRFVVYPWEGVNYSLGGHELAVTKSWSTMGIKRVAGTLRSSISASTAILALCILLYPVARTWSIKGVLLVTAGIAIGFTTTKGVLAAWLLLLPALLAGPKRASRVYKVTVAAFLSLLLAAPVIGMGAARLLNVDDPMVRMLAWSLEDRILNTWPRALDLVLRSGDPVFGRGMGGLGVPQALFEPSNYLAADNLMVFLWANLGIAGIVLFILLCFKVMRRVEARDAWASWIPGALAFVVIYGVTASVLEGPILALFMGMLAAHAFEPVPVVQKESL